MRDNGGNSTRGEINKDPLPEGRYDFKVIKAKLGASSKKKTPSLDLFVKVVGNSDEYDRTAWITFYLTDKSLWKLGEFLQKIEHPDARNPALDETVLVDSLNATKPVFSAFANVDQEYGSNSFEGFTAASSDASSVPSAASVTVPSDDDDLPI